MILKATLFFIKRNTQWRDKFIPAKMEYHMKLALIKTVKKMVNGIAIIAIQAI